MTRITHMAKQPKNIQYWDYMILCRLNSEAAIALQRMEYWDGTKDMAIVHAEAENDALLANNQPPTQEISHWVYKTQEELRWELMGITGEKGVTAILKFLEEDLHYLVSRNNPVLQLDRRKQYEFQYQLVQNHLNYLAYIVSFFEQRGCRLAPVYYAIELLTRENRFIERLSVARVLHKLNTMQHSEKLPRFIQAELKKDTALATFLKQTTPSALLQSQCSPCRNFATWKAHFCDMDSAESRPRFRKIATWIPQNRGNNNNNYNNNNYVYQSQSSRRVKSISEEKSAASLRSRSDASLSGLSQEEKHAAEEGARMIEEEIQAILTRLQELGVTVNASVVNPSSTETTPYRVAGSLPLPADVDDHPQSDTDQHAAQSRPGAKNEACNLVSTQRHDRKASAVRFAPETQIDAYAQNDTSSSPDEQAGSVSYSPKKDTGAPEKNKKRANNAAPAAPEAEQADPNRPRLPGKPGEPPALTVKIEDFIVQYTEYRLGKYYTPTQYKTNRKAAVKIVKAGGTREGYVLAYDDTNRWWKGYTESLLHVVNMAANTKHRQMRYLEVTQKLDDQQTIAEQQAAQPTVPPTPGAIPGSVPGSTPTFPASTSTGVPRSPRIVESESVRFAREMRARFEQKKAEKAAEKALVQA